MKYYSSIILLNKYLDKLLLIEYKRNKFDLILNEYNGLINISDNAFDIFNIININVKYIKFFEETFVYTDNTQIIYFIVCVLDNDKKYTYFGNDYYDIRFISYDYLCKNNIINSVILENINHVIFTKLLSYKQFVSIIPNYNKVRYDIILLLRQNLIEINEDGYASILEVKKYLDTKYNKIIDLGHIYVAYIFDTKKKLDVKKNNMLIRANYRHNIELQNIINDDIAFELFDISNYDGDIYFIDNYNHDNINFLSAQCLHFIFLLDISKKSIKTIYKSYNNIYKINKQKIIEYNIKFYKANDNVLLSRGIDNMFPMDLF